MIDPVEALKAFLRCPSVSADSSYKEGMLGAQDFLSSLFSGMGLEVELVKTPKHPIVLARKGGDPAWPHVVIYGHYDVQPADPFELWETDPFDPLVKGGRLYARGAADNKGPLMVHIAAVADLLAENPDFPMRITFLVEGEEEIGSPSFPEFVEKHKDTTLDADMVLLSDTSSPSAEQVGITTALRGLAGLEVHVEGPSGDLHSGVHGGAVYNPIQALTEICASLHGPDGKVNVPGFYDSVIEPVDWEIEELAKLPTTESSYKEFLGVPEFYELEGINPIAATRFAPALDFNGITGGYQGEGSKTIIPSKASTKITFRLVASQDPDVAMKQIKDAITERCPKGVRVSFKEVPGGAPYKIVPPGRPNSDPEQSPVLAKAFQLADDAITSVFGKKPLYLAEGGSIPIISQLKDVAGLDSLMIGLFTSESNLHAPNESFDLKLMERAIEASRRILWGLSQ